MWIQKQGSDCVRFVMLVMYLSGNVHQAVRLKFRGEAWEEIKIP